MLMITLYAEQKKKKKEGSLFYRILLFSAKYRHESAIGVHMSPPS